MERYYQKRLRRIHDDISIIICDLSKISEN